MSESEKKLRTGMTCVWYERADRDSDPIAAVVTGASRHDENMLHLSLFRQGMTELQPLRNVRHVDDPYLTEHPMVAQNNGGWDTVYSQDLSTRKRPQVPAASRG